MLQRFLSRALLLAPAGAIIGLVITAMMAWKNGQSAASFTTYESEVLIQYLPTPTRADGLGRTPKGCGVEFDISKSYYIGEIVIKNLNLTKHWNVTSIKAHDILSNITNSDSIQGTDLRRIRVHHANPEDAQNIAREVAAAYKTFRDEIETRDAERYLSDLKRAVREQEDKVEERRKVLATIVRTKDIIYKGDKSFYEAADDEGHSDQKAFQIYHQLEQEKLQLESQISSLLKLGNDQLPVYAAGLDLPDNVVRKLYPKYMHLKREIEGFKINGLDDKHPKVKDAQEKLEKMKEHLDEGIVNLRATLQAQLKLANSRLMKLEKMKNESREDAIKHGLDVQDYIDAKRDFECDQELLQVMKLKLISETIEQRIPGEINQIISKPSTAKRVSFGLLESTIYGLITGLILAFPAALIRPEAKRG